MDKVKNLLGLNKFKAIKKVGDETTSSLIKILDKKKIGRGGYADIYKSNVAIGNRVRKFAIKTFIPGAEQSVDRSISMHEQLKKLGIPTGTTYRKMGEKSILMTLGNNDGSLVFSANNGSNDSKKVKENPISKISETSLDSLFTSALDITYKMSSHNILSFFDAFMFAYKDGELKFIVGDFDNLRASEQDMPTLMAKNIEEICYCFLRASSYFNIEENIFDKFAYYLSDLQKKGDKRLDNVDLQAIFNKVYKQLVRESAG